MKSYKKMNVSIAVAIVVLVVYALIVFEVGAAEMPMKIGSVIEADSQLPVLVASDIDQLQHENNMALIATAMRVGEICVLLSVEKHAKSHNKPISLNELAQQSDTCVKTHLKSLERK